MILELSDGQIDLLKALAGGGPAKIFRRIVWIDRQKFSVRDLLTLRAARLVVAKQGLPVSEQYVITEAGRAYLKATQQPEA